MNAKEQAIALMNHYKGVVYPYLGSGYLTGTEDRNLIFENAKKEAKYLIKHMTEVKFPYVDNAFTNTQYTHLTYWSKVGTELDTLTIDEILPIK